MKRLTPRLQVLPVRQRRLWPLLTPLAGFGFVLRGGTAIALQLGHRVSVDFDFFSVEPLDALRLRAALPFLAKAALLQEEPNALTWRVGRSAMLSCFGAVSTGHVGTPRLTDDGVAWAASLDDLLAHKLKVIMQRIEAKDYRDIAAMLGAGQRLRDGLAAASAIFGGAFSPSECLRAPAYFEGGDLQSLSIDDRLVILEQVKRWKRGVPVPVLRPGLLDRPLRRVGKLP